MFPNSLSSAAPLVKTKSALLANKNATVVTAIKYLVILPSTEPSGPSFPVNATIEFTPPTIAPPNSTKSATIGIIESPSLIIIA